MDVLNRIIENFKSSSARFLVLFSVVGIVVSSQSFYNSINSNIDEKLNLLDKWEKIKYRNIPNSCKDILYKEVVKELQNSDKNGDYAISLLLKKATYFPLITLLYKFLAGTFLYLFVYGIQILTLTTQAKKHNKLKVSTYDILKRNKHIIFAFFALGTINMIIPIFSYAINYIFIPSFLTLLYAVSQIIQKEAEVNTPIENEIDTSGLC